MCLNIAYKAFLYMSVWLGIICVRACKGGVKYVIYTFAS